MKLTTFIAGAVAVAGLLMLATSAKAADKPVPKLVPYKACLTQAQAREVYPGKHLKYREVQGERCWFAGKTLPKSAFIPRSTSVASKPIRTIINDAQRVSGSAGAVPAAGTSIHRTEFTATLDADAYLALSGKPETDYSFDAYWNLMTGWAR